MPKHTDRVRIEEVDWQAVLPWTRLFGSFRMAMHPNKLVTAVMLVVLLYLAGCLLDGLMGRPVHRGELDQYRQLHFGLQSEASFDAWLRSRDDLGKQSLLALLGATPGFKEDIDAIVAGEDRLDKARAALHAHHVKEMEDIKTERDETGYEKDWEADLSVIRQARKRQLAAIESLRPIGPFSLAARQATGAADRLARAVITLNIGWAQLGSPVTSGEGSGDFEPMVGEGGSDRMPSSAGAALAYYDQTTAVAALRDLFVILPGWLWHQHRSLLIVFLCIALLLMATLGGAIARMAALHATRDDRVWPGEALRFVWPRWWSFLLAPLVPVALIAVIAVVMGLGGLIFNIEEWGIDIIAALFFVVAILCGVIIMAAIVLTAAGIHMAYPATAINGSDVFDAIARAFNYALNRPWRWLFYNLVVIVHGSVMYLLLAAMLAIAMAAVCHFTGMWVFAPSVLGENRFDTILPLGEAGSYLYSVDMASLDWSGRVAAGIIRCWVFMTAAILAGFAVSYYFCANTWVYMLLRRDADGIELEDVMIDPPFDPSAKPVVQETAEESAVVDADDEEE